MRREITGGHLETVVPHRQAAEVHSLGVRRNNQIAVVGNGFYHFWARLARVRIVAEVPDWDAGKFWAATDDARSGALAAIRGTGARAVVTGDAAAVGLPGWQPVDGGRLHVRFLDGPAGGR